MRYKRQNFKNIMDLYYLITFKKEDILLLDNILNTPIIHSILKCYIIDTESAVLQTLKKREGYISSIDISNTHMNQFIFLHET